ncbi:MAG: lipopolysaccharide assembly protein LapA domain-containing protein [Aquificaceae bacterium]|nr:lipopolysaccharide assembly protein LapA domain-containing protein [Aquificaceae bacterium]
MNLIKILLSLSLVVLFLLFIAQNAGYVEVSFFYTVYKVPLFVLLLLSFTLGFFIPSFYFIFKEVGLKRKLNSIDQGLKELSRGYINRAERILGGPAKSLQGIKSILAKLFIEQGRVEEAKAFDPILVGELFLKEGKLQEAEEEFKKALSQDEENLKALKGLRDVYSLQDRWQEALEYQDKMLDLCERW